MITGKPRFSEKHFFHGLMPVIRVGDYDVSPYLYLKIHQQLIGWRYMKLDKYGLYWLVRHNDDLMRLRAGHFLTVANEYKMWSKTYIPSFSLEDKTVLDVGAGCGESAHFFFQKRAKKVVSIENDPLSLLCLRENAARNGWNLEIVPESFTASHLRDFSFDFAKIDVEGAERCLLGLSSLPPCSIETHTPQLTNMFVQKFGMEVIHSFPKHIGVSIVTNSRPKKS